MPVCELDSNGSVGAQTMFGAWGLVSRNTPSTGTTFYAFDARGNVAHRTNSSGAVTSTDVYDAYGQKRSGPADVWGFGGQAGYSTDAETGLVLCTNRHYDPQSGRFLTRDPLGYAGGINLYSYTQNNPVNWMDPSGHGLMAGLGGAGGLRLVNTLKLWSAFSGTVQDIESAKPEPTQIVEMAEQAVERTPDAGPDRVLEGAEAEQVGSDIGVDQAARNGWNSSLLEEGGGATTEGVGVGTEGVSVAGGGATLTEGAAVGLGPIAVITAGVVAIGDLGTYIVTDKAKGPFTRLGTWLGDQLFPGQDGLPAPDAPRRSAPRRKGCR